MTLDAKLLRELLHYDSASGVFTRLVASGRHGCHRAGQTIGGPNGHGYTLIGVNGTRYRAHHLVWLYVHGEWPSAVMDHINGDRTDNRLSNLRVASLAINAQNIRVPKSHNKSGFLGVSRFRDKWQASITVGGVSRNLGVFTTPESAHAVYLEHKRVLHLGCTI